MFTKAFDSYRQNTNVHKYIYIYIYIYTHTHTHTNGNEKCNLDHSKPFVCDLQIKPEDRIVFSRTIFFFALLDLNLFEKGW